MNGTLIDIAGISCNVNPIELQDSTDMAHIIVIKDEFKEVHITIIYGRITDTKEIYCSK